MKNLSYFSFLMLIVLSISCQKDEPEIPNEEELITTVTYTLTPEGGGSPIIMSFTDLDGDGGESPSIVSQPLSANTTYSGVLELLNEQESPAESISEEVEEEAEEHQFFFSSSLSSVSVSYDDTDSDGNPIGLRTKLTTGEVGMGDLTITLKHEPNKSAAGVSDGNIENAGGETDIEVTFALDVR